MASMLHAIFESSDFYLWGRLKTRVYAAYIDNGKTLHHRMVDACQIFRNCPSVFAQMRRSIMRRVEVHTESHGDILST
jgi:hypothetical protein